MSELAPRSSRFLLLAVSSLAIVGTLVLVIAILPLAQCFICQGKGRYTWREAQEEVQNTRQKGGDFVVIERRIITPAISSKCSLCSGTGKLTYAMKWKAQSQKELKLEPIDTREEGKIISYSPEIETPESKK
jgi:hypothetical protein